MARTAFLSLLLLALVATAHCKGGADRGIAYLGSFTFYRVVDGSRDVLVRFDEKHYWHTGFDEAFEELAQTVAMSHLVNSSQIDCNKFIVASLPVSKMQHEVDNIVIARRYNISHADFPAIRLFKKGADPKDMPLQPPPEVSTRSPAQMMRWIEQETGVFCGLIGQLKDMHLLAQQLVNNSAAAPELLAKARLVAERVDDSDKDNAKTYLEVFEKAVEDTDWPWNEYQRLKAKMPKFSMHVAPDSWRDAQHQRLHILSSFVDSVQEELSELKEEL